MVFGFIKNLFNKKTSLELRDQKENIISKEVNSPNITQPENSPASSIQTFSDKQLTLTKPNVPFEQKGNEYRKRDKGNSLLQFPDDFIVIDTETTGLDPEYDELIEVCAVKVIAGQEVDRFESLIKPSQEIADFITELTGISNDMLRDAPLPEKVIPELKYFIGDNILVAHNAHFDINFLYDNFDNHLNETFSNDFVCTMRLCRRIFPKFKNHKLKTICKNLLIDLPTHRALGDVISTWEVYKCCRTTVEQNIGFEEFGSQSLKARNIKTKIEDFDIDHPLYGRTCVFTGTLSKMLRRDAMQIVVDLGGLCADNINKNTNYLVLGIQDYRKFKDGEKSSKLKKAEDLINNEFDIEIISENNFYDLINEVESYFDAYYIKENELSNDNLCHNVKNVNIENKRIKNENEKIDNEKTFDYDQIDNDIYKCFIAHKSGMCDAIGTWENFYKVEEKIAQICKDNSGNYFKGPAKSARYAIIFSYADRVYTAVTALREKGFKVTTFEKALEYFGLADMWDIKALLKREQEHKEFLKYRISQNSK